MIKQKIGFCRLCDNSKETPLIGKLCKNHYWKGRADMKSKNPPQKKYSKIPLSTQKRAKELEIYSKMRLVFLRENPNCQTNGIIKGCTIKATEVHHKKGKIGNLLITESNFLSICRSCHRWVTDNSKEAVEMGLSDKRNT
mgnify:FL=1